MPITLTHSGTSVYSSDAPSRELLVGTADGVVTLERVEPRAGSDWRIASRALAGSHVSSMIVPSPDLILAAIHHGGIVASRDGGKSWERSDKGIAHNDVYSLGATRLNGRLRLFAGTEPAHFYISDDLGGSWRESPTLRSVPSVPRWTFPGPPHEAHVKVITVAPDDPSTVYASVEQGGLLKSTDAGESWRELSGFDSEFDFDVHRLVIHPTQPKRLLLMGGMGLWVSEDGGERWLRYTDSKSPIGGYPDQLTYVPSRAGVLIASGARANPGTWMQNGFAASRIGISGDGGRAWKVFAGGVPAQEKWQSAIEAMTLEEHDGGFSLFVGTTAGEVFATDDSGESWKLIAESVGPISKGMHYLAIQFGQRAAAAH